MSLKPCCEKHIRNIHREHPDIVWGSIDCPVCGHFWGFTGFSDDVEKDIRDLLTQTKRDE